MIAINQKDIESHLLGAKNGYMTRRLYNGTTYTGSVAEDTGDPGSGLRPGIMRGSASDGRKMDGEALSGICILLSSLAFLSVGAGGAMLYGAGPGMESIYEY